MSYAGMETLNPWYRPELTTLERLDRLSARVAKLIRQLDDHAAYMHEWRLTGVEPTRLLDSGRLRRSTSAVITKQEIHAAITTGPR